MRFEDLGRYDYDLPPELIRKKGVEPRDSARLFAYETLTDTVAHERFADVAKHIPDRSVLVLNETRVVPARLWLVKETGGRIEAFVLMNEWTGNPDDIPILVDRKVTVGQKLHFPNGDAFEVAGQAENRFFVKLHSVQSRRVEAAPVGGGGQDALSYLLDRYGETPVPHYLEDETTAGQSRDDREQELRKRYQTIFAAGGASVAAPTASLHFTDRVFESLARKRVEIVRVRLDVGLGTFAPLREEHFRTGALHRERIAVSEETAAALNAAKQNRRPIVAVGTTVLRTLESIADEAGVFRPYSGPTDIFIHPPYRFRSADILITNFHLPKTSLLLLVNAFLGWKGAPRCIVELYKDAIRERYSFYSFGDSMLIR